MTPRAVSKRDSNEGVYISMLGCFYQWHRRKYTEFLQFQPESRSYVNQYLKNAGSSLKAGCNLSLADNTASVPVIGQEILS